MSFFFGMIGIAFMIAAKELRFHANPFDLSANQTRNLVVFILRCLQSLTTVCLIYCIFCYYRSDWRFVQLNRQFLKQIKVWTSDRIFSFLLEVLVCLVHEPPFYDMDIDISLPVAEQGLGGSPTGIIYLRNPFALIMFIRIYLVMRLVLTRYYSGGTKILGVWHHFEFSIPFAIRNMLHSHPAKTLLLAGLIICGSTSYSLHVCDREAGGIRNSLLGSFWIVLITMPAVGYGDMYPVTLCGRGVVLLAALTGVMLVAVITATVYSMLSLMPFESRMVEFLDSASARNDLLELASSVIAKAWRFYKARDQGEWERGSLKRDLILTIDVFYATRLNVMAADSRFQNNQLFRALLERIQSDVDMLVRHMSNRAKTLKEEQKARKKDLALKKEAAESSESDSDGESSGTDKDKERRAEEKRDQERKDQEAQVAAAESGAAAIGSPSAAGGSSSSGLGSIGDSPSLKSALKNPGATMAALAATVPATTATVLRAQLPRLVEQVMATMKSQLQDVHSNVKQLHSRLDRLETQLSDTRVLLKSQTDGSS